MAREKTKTVFRNVRFTANQVRWLLKRADQEFDGNFSAAARRAVTEARLLELARAEYDAQVAQGLDLPNHADGSANALRVILSGRLGGLVEWDDDSPVEDDEPSA